MHNYRSRKINQIVLAFLFLSSIFSSVLSANAQSNPDDWLVVVSTQPSNQLFNYAGSPLAPVIKASINYTQSGQTVLYEDLYFSQGHAIGCRQYHALNIIPGSGGVIQVQNLPNAGDQQGWALANAVIRVYLDLYTHRVLLRYISVPIGSFDNLVQGFQKWGFSSTDIMSGQSVGAATVVHLISTPPGRSQELAY